MRTNFFARPGTGILPLAISLAACLFASTGISAELPPRDAEGRLPGTAKMAAFLATYAARINPLEAEFLSTPRADLWKKRMALTTTEAQRAEIRLELATDLLFAGQFEESLKELDAFESFLRKNDPAGLASFEGYLRVLRVQAWLRLGEQENCLARHGPESCILPLAGSAIHVDKRGSQNALAEVNSWLKQEPGNLTARWLMNVTAMTLGEYPDRVPEKWLIPPKTFASDYDIKRFVDVAGNAGLTEDGLAGGCVMDDFDGDLDLDIMASSSGIRDQIRYYRNNGDGTFSDRTREAGLIGITGGLNLVHADYNNDGLIDVLVLRGGWWKGPAGRQIRSLLKNHGNGVFEDVTEAAGMLSFHPSQTATWFDYDSDGDIDLFIGNETSGTEVNPCQLYRNNGNGTFTNVAAAADVDVRRFVKAVSAGDYNNDGRPDLYLSCQSSLNILLRNDGPDASGQGWRFTDVTREAGVGEPFYSFPAWFWDYDNDGWLDLFVAGYKIKGIGENSADIAADYLGLPHDAERCRLYRNKRDGTFEDVTKAAGMYKVVLAMGSNFGDLDNDGFLDMYLGTGNPDFTTIIPNRMFRNDGGKRFQDVTTSGGFGHLQKGHGIAFGDIDHDGDQDVFEVMGGAYEGDNFRNVLFRNPGHGNRWVKLILEGTKANRAAIGARVKIIATGKGGSREIHRVIGEGGSFGCNPFRLEAGLGQSDAIESVEIRWPGSNTIQQVRNLQPGGMYRIVEGKEPVRVKEPATFTFSSDESKRKPL